MTLPQPRTRPDTTPAVRDLGRLDVLRPPLLTKRPQRLRDRRGVVVVARLTLATVSGLSMWLAFPPYDLWWAAVVGPALLTLLVRGLTGKAAFGYATLSGMALFAPLLTWTSNVGPDAWLALSALQALFLGGLGVVLAKVGSMRWWPVWTAAAWVVQEALRGRFPFGGFTWGRLAFAQTEGPLLDYAALRGSRAGHFRHRLARRCRRRDRSSGAASATAWERFRSSRRGNRHPERGDPPGRPGCP